MPTGLVFRIVSPLTDKTKVELFVLADASDGICDALIVKREEMFTSANFEQTTPLITRVRKCGLKRSRKL